ncbi:unnamed protein product [Callosobruchus maculatus]|uniref:Uncharacterized protein n=1 Tax=Callosobruchus maculatus TaxID=64391 RepID=A0A653DB25_CALMS|nr:unnamed protein product [Callosobruchus maculatus]
MKMDRRRQPFLLCAGVWALCLIGLAAIGMRHNLLFYSVHQKKNKRISNTHNMFCFENFKTQNDCAYAFLAVIHI